MKLLRILILFFTFIFGVSAVVADTDDATKKILEKAKEINEQVKKKQAESAANIKAEVDNEVKEKFTKSTEPKDIFNELFGEKK